MQVICVLKMGGQYGPEHVARLRDQHDLPMSMLTDCKDNVSGVKTIPLVHGFDGWWSKIELFRPDIYAEDAIYLDLDVSVIGDLRSLASDKFTMCADFILDGRKNSSVMAWKHQPITPYTMFIQNAERFMAKYRRSPNIGDQAFIEDTCRNAETFEPGRVISYRKCDMLGQRPDNCVVVAYHGSPKPWQV